MVVMGPTGDALGHRRGGVRNQLVVCYKFQQFVIKQYWLSGCNAVASLCEHLRTVPYVHQAGPTAHVG